MSAEMKGIGIILSAAPYSFTDERTGEMREGLSIMYLDAADLSPRYDSGNHGIRVAKDSIPKDRIRNIVSAPGVYTLVYKAVPGSNMKMMMKLHDVSYLGDVFGYTLENMPDYKLDEYFTAEVLEKIRGLTAAKK